jgi:hypothetical protein
MASMRSAPTATRSGHTAKLNACSSDQLPFSNYHIISGAIHALALHVHPHQPQFLPLCILPMIPTAFIRVRLNIPRRTVVASQPTCSFGELSNAFSSVRSHCRSITSVRSQLFTDATTACEPPIQTHETCSASDSQCV